MNKINPRLLATLALMAIPVALGAGADPAFAEADPLVSAAGDNGIAVLEDLDTAVDKLPLIAWTLLGVAVTGVLAKVGFKTVRRFIGG